MAAHIARLRLHNSGLTGAPFDAPADVVSHHVAMQAQDVGPARWSVGQRCTGADDEDVARALDDGRILRTHVLRPTWHYVARDDLRWLLALTGPRVQKHSGPRYRELGLDARTLARCEKRITGALEGNRHLTRQEIGKVLGAARIDVEGQRLPYILSHCELEAVICSGVRDGSRHTYALFDERVPRDESFDRDDATIQLVSRYLEARQPATIKDLRWWSSLTIADLKSALEALGAEVENGEVDGVEFWWLRDRADSKREHKAHLLQAYDEVIVGYTESRFFGDPYADAARRAWKERKLPTGLLVIGERIAGHWRRTMTSSSVDIEVLTYEELAPRDRRALDRAAAELGTFLGKEPTLTTSLL